MKPVLLRPWEGTWWFRLVSLAMLAALLVAGYGVLRSLGDEDERDDFPTRRAYELIENPTAEIDCADIPDICRELLDGLATAVAEGELPDRARGR